MSHLYKFMGGVSIHEAQKMICSGTYGPAGTNFSTEQRSEACKNSGEVHNSPTTGMLIFVLLAVALAITFYI